MFRLFGSELSTVNRWNIFILRNFFLHFNYRSNDNELNPKGIIHTSIQLTSDLAKWMSKMNKHRWTVKKKFRWISQITLFSNGGNCKSRLMNSTSINATMREFQSVESYLQKAFTTFNQFICLNNDSIIIFFDASNRCIFFILIGERHKWPHLNANDLFFFFLAFHRWIFL